MSTALEGPEGRTGPGAAPGLAVVLWLTAFALAFAWIESAVVHYLHNLFYPEGFNFPLKPWPASMLAVEVGREFGTIVVIATVAFLAARPWWLRLAAFMYAFGLWDIFYYVWLVLFEGWPGSPFTRDLLFLLPVPWTGPVLAPVLVSAGLICSAGVVYWRFARDGVLRPGLPAVSLTLGGWVLILVSFMADCGSVIESGVAGRYLWELFTLGMALWAAAIFRLSLTAGRSRNTE